MWGSELRYVVSGAHALGSDEGRWTSGTATQSGSGAWWLPVASRGYGVGAVWPHSTPASPTLLVPLTSRGCPGTWSGACNRHVSVGQRRGGRCSCFIHAVSDLLSAYCAPSRARHSTPGPSANLRGPPGWPSPFFSFWSFYLCMLTRESEFKDAKEIKETAQAHVSLKR